MNAYKNALLLDTNVWLDYHCNDRSGHDDAFKLVDTALRSDWPLLIASHSLKDFWYIFWRGMKVRGLEDAEMSSEDASSAAKVAAWAAAEQITQIAVVVGSDVSDSWLALKMRSTHNDYEDNLIVAAAMRAKPRLLVTNDQGLIAHCPVAVATPRDALDFLEIV